MAKWRLATVLVKKRCNLAAGTTAICRRLAKRLC
jgi:hypothetical protein